jgi:hypothetical protein
MAVYSCRSYRRKPPRRGNVKSRVRRFRGRRFKKIIPVFYKCFSRRSSLSRFIKPVRLFIRSTHEGRFYLSPNVGAVRSFKSQNLRLGAKYSSVNTRLVSSFKSGRFGGKKNPRVELVSSFAIGRVYRHLNIYKFPVFWETPRLKKVILVCYNSRKVNQDSSYFFINKSDLIEFGLIPNGDNSYAELISSLLLLWESKLESSRINVAFYRYLKFQEESNWFESKAMLVNVLSLPSDSKSFPSPRSLSL